MTVKIEPEDKSALELRQLAGRVKDGRVPQRLLAIAMVLEGMRRKVAAEICGMDRQRLCDWVRRYNAEGVEGLGNRRGGGVNLLLTSDQLAQLETWVADGPDPKRDGVVGWRRVDLARRIEVDFGIKLHESTVGRYLARLGFRWMSVRLEHPKSDPQTLAASKNTLPLWLQKSCQTRRRESLWRYGSRTRQGLVKKDADPHLGKARDTSLPMTPSE